MERQEILAEASCVMDGSREERYGDFAENHERIGVLWGAILQTDPIPAHLVALCMTAVKISRMVADPTHLDNYIDAVAYTAGAGEIATLAE